MEAPHKIVLVFLALCLLASSCALNPYGDPTRHPVDATAPGAHTGPASLEAARQYAERTYDDYHRQLAAEYTRQRRLSAGLLGIGAAVLGLAAFDAGTDAITATALAGGTGYTIGTWNTSRPRLHIYVEGMNALVCAKRAVQPVALSRPVREGLVADIGRVIRQGEEVADNAGALTTALAKATGRSGGTRTAQRLLTAVEPALDRAGAAYVKGHSLLQASHTAGADLKDAVDRIRSDVALAVEGTLSDLSSLPNVIAGLAPAAQIFAPQLDLAATLSGRLAPSPADPQPSRADGEVDTRSTSKRRVQPHVPAVDLSRPIGDLSAALLKLDQASARVAAVAATVDLKQIDKLLAAEGCGLEPGQLSTEISLSRTRIDLKPAAAATHFVRVTGGTLPYQANLLSLPAPGISLNMRGDTLTIVADTHTRAGDEHVVEVSDTANHRAAVTVAIEPAPISSANAGSPTHQPEDVPAGELVGDDETRLLAPAPAKRKAVQAGLCTPESPRDYDPVDRIDGRFGPRTRFRILQYVMASRSHPADQLAQLDANDIEVLSDDQVPGECAGHLNWFEKQTLLDKPAVCEVRVRLGLEARLDEALDDDARRAIQKISEPEDPEAALFGQLSGRLLNQIRRAEADTVELDKCR